jgi:serine/threonine-protein kinase
VKEEVSNRPPGTVLRTDPRAGAAVWPGSPVDLVIAKRNVTVPNVVGKDQAQAKQVLRDDGLSVGSVTEKLSEQPPGTVLSTDPKAGTPVRSGSAVNLVVAKAPPMESGSGGEVSKNPGAVADRRDKKTG